MECSSMCQTCENTDRKTDRQTDRQTERKKERSAEKCVSKEYTSSCVMDGFFTSWLQISLMVLGVAKKEGSSASARHRQTMTRPAIGASEDLTGPQAYIACSTNSIIEALFCSQLKAITWSNKTTLHIAAHY